MGRVDPGIIQRLRTERGWSQEDLAGASDLNIRTVQRIEKSGAASLRSKRSIAEAFDLDVVDLEGPAGADRCSECGSQVTYEYKGLIDSSTIGGELVPKLAPSRFSGAKLRCRVCGQCGYVRYFVDDEARLKLKSSKHWELL